MQRPEEVENSEARARDRGQPQGLTFFEAATPDEARYLGSPSDVEDTVREFCASAHEIRSAALDGKLTPDAALQRLNALCDAYAAIFYGRNKSFRAMPFNSPQMLGAFINDRLGMTEPVEDAARILFMNVANQLFAAHEAHQAGEWDDEDVRFVIESAIDDAKAILLGLPPSVEEE